MALSKVKKREILATLGDILSKATSVAFVGFNKLSVADTGVLRRELAKDSVRYFVAKKTLLRIALKERGYAEGPPELPGEVAIAWTAGDSTAPARLVHQFGKKIKGTLVLLGGIFEGSFADREKINAIATIPSMPILRGRFLNVINSPLQGFVVALNKIRAQKV